MKNLYLSLSARVAEGTIFRKPPVLEHYNCHYEDHSLDTHTGIPFERKHILSLQIIYYGPLIYRTVTQTEFSS